MNRSEIVDVVLSALRSQLELDGGDVDPATADESSVLLGSEALVDSLGLVNVIIEVEQVLLDEHDLSVTIVDEKAMSEARSPFRTVGTLADHVVQALGQG